MKNDTERGLIGAWARKERLALGLSVEQVVARLADRGATIDPAYLRAIESGSKRPRPDSEVVEALGAVYKSRPTSDEPVTAPAADMAQLIAAMTQQAQSFTGLMDELRQARQGRDRLTTALESMDTSDLMLSTKFAGGGR